MPLTPGTRLGPYEILAPLGAGGMGEVYRARDSRLERDVAIKILPEAVAKDPEALARFRREATAGAAVAHPNVLAVFDVGVEGEVAWVVTELLEGSTLRARIERGALPTSEAIDVARQMAAGLAALHTRGIVHRDLKPDNVFITSDGHVKILDFGLSGRMTPPGTVDEHTPTLTRLTTPGTVLGTPGYMAPEQLNGRPTDTRTDLFVLGAILYEMLAGRRAFSGSTWAEVAASTLREEPPPLPPERAGALEGVLRRCLRKEPSERYSGAGEIVAALDVVSASGRMMPGGFEAERPARAPRAGLSRGIRLALIGAVAAVAAAVVITLVVIGGRGRREAPPSAGAVAARANAIAMLEFENLTGDPSFDWMSRGFPELLGTALARSTTLDVYDPQRLSNLLAPDRPGAAPERPMFEQLHGHGVGRAIVGSILRAGPEVRIQCRIVDVADGRVQHADAVSGPADADLFRLSGDLVQKIQTWLEIDVVTEGTAGEWLHSLTTTSSDAYRLYLGEHEALLGFKWRQAAELGEQVVAIDSQFVAARVDLVGAYWNLGDVTRMRQHLDALDRMRPRANPRDVLQIDLIQAVIKRDPEGLIRAASAAHEIFPENRHFTYLLGRGYWTANRYAQCLEVLTPLMAERYGWAWTYVLSGLSHQKLGQLDEARRCFELGMDVTGRNPEVACEYANLLLATGDSTTARAVLVGAAASPDLDETPEYEAAIRVALAGFHEREGHPDSARAEYERAMAVLRPEPAPPPKSVNLMKEASAGLARTGGGN